MGAAQRKGLVWNSSNAIHVAGIDAAHEELFRSAVELIEALRAGDRPSAEALLSSIEACAVEHFREEEDCLREVAGAAVYGIAHKRFAREYGELKRVFEASGASATVLVKTESWLVDWLQGHVAWIAAMAQKAPGGRLPPARPLPTPARGEAAARAADPLSRLRREPVEAREEPRRSRGRLRVALGVAAAVLALTGASWAALAGGRGARLAGLASAVGRQAAAPWKGFELGAQETRPEASPQAEAAPRASPPPGHKAPGGKAPAAREPPQRALAAGGQPGPAAKNVAPRPAAAGGAEPGRQIAAMTSRQASEAKAQLAKPKEAARHPGGNGSAWGAAQWGMTVEDILLAFPGQAARVEQRGAGAAAAPGATIEHAQIGSRAGAVRFFFDASGRLGTVQVRPVQAGEDRKAVFDEVAASLAEQYGKPSESRSEDPERKTWTRNATWRTPDSEIELSACQGLEPPTKILYIDMKGGEISRDDVCGVAVVLHPAAR